MHRCYAEQRTVMCPIFDVILIAMHTCNWGPRSAGGETPAGRYSAERVEYSLHAVPRVVTRNMRGSALW
jgi:hypothetical protein